MDGHTTTHSPATHNPKTTTSLVEDYVSTVKNQAGNLKAKYIDNTLSTAGAYIKDNPGKTILVSLAAGVLIGSLLRRR